MLLLSCFVARLRASFGIFTMFPQGEFMTADRAAIVILGLALAGMVVPSPASAEFIIVYGGPTWDVTTLTGSEYPRVPMQNYWGLTGDGVAVDTVTRYERGRLLGDHAVRWDASGTPPMELGNLGTESSGKWNSYVSAINTAGVAVGTSNKFIDGNWVGNRAVRWDALGRVTELDALGKNNPGYTYAQAINKIGTAVGQGDKYSGGMRVGGSALRWDASGTAVTELGNLGTDNSGAGAGEVLAINDAGAAVGSSVKYIGGTNLGTRAVRWDASGTAATELGNLGADSNGATVSIASAINSAGTVVGSSRKYS